MTQHPGRVADYLDHMLEAAQQACSYVHGMSKEDFLSDKRTQQAVILNLILIGEEATKLLRDDEGFAQQHSQVPWRNMKGMRNRLGNHPDRLAATDRAIAIRPTHAGLMQSQSCAMAATPANSHIDSAL